jgi:aryl-alcohol dehydrogenase-like predicted oxidoreductase
MVTMKRRPLGPSGIQASAIAFGAWALGGWRWGGSDEKTSVDALRAGLDAGIDFIDTAPAYGFGRGEEIVGKAIQGRRDRVVVATKCGLVWDEPKGVFFFASDDKGRRDDGPRRIHKYAGADRIRTDLEGSLKRLGTDYVDLYLTHWQDPTTPVEETMSCLLDLKRQGKIRAIGACNAATSDLDRYRKLGPVDADQERFSLLDRKLEKTNLAWTRANGAAVMAYSPLEHGLLTGKAVAGRKYGEGDLRNDHPNFRPENLVRILGILDRLKPVAERHRATLSQLVLAWTIAQPGVTHALAGARTPAQAVENARAGELDLGAADLAEIEAAARTGAAATS